MSVWIFILDPGAMTVCWDENMSRPADPSVERVGFLACGDILLNGTCTSGLNRFILCALGSSGAGWDLVMVVDTLFAHGGDFLKCILISVPFLKV